LTCLFDSFILFFIFQFLVLSIDFVFDTILKKKKKKNPYFWFRELKWFLSKEQIGETKPIWHFCDLMAIRPFQSTFSLHTFFSLFRTPPNPFSSAAAATTTTTNFPQPYSILRRFTVSSSTSFSRPPRRPQLPPPPPPPPSDTLAHKIGKAIRLPGATSKARVYADINVVRPKEYWDYESLAVQWG
jgi:hypothetical protein